jgi:hypothetical protein
LQDGGYGNPPLWLLQDGGYGNPPYCVDA